MILVTGGADLSAPILSLTGWQAATSRSSTWTSSPTPATWRTWPPSRAIRGTSLCKGDIGDSALVAELLAKHKPRAMLNFAAESHVDRSIRGSRSTSSRPTLSAPFACWRPCASYWAGLPEGEKAAFRFLQVSTDEVYGSLKPADPAFSETHRYEPNSPYSASKAASDHLTRAYHHTYGLPVLTTNCSNNYGPYHFPEKLIPLMIVNALAGKPLPVYGDGQQVRDWLYVKDHCSAHAPRARSRQARRDLQHRRQQREAQHRHRPCGVRPARRVAPARRAAATANRSAFIKDRPGHDRRYAIDAAKMTRELGWKPAETFETGIRKTVQWYLDNPEWVTHVQSGAYRDWVDAQYATAAA